MVEEYQSFVESGHTCPDHARETAAWRADLDEARFLLFLPSMTPKTRILLPAVLLTAACGLPEPPGELVKSSLERDMAPQLSEAEQRDFAADRAAAAFDLYRQTEKTENLVVSPYSLDAVMAMLYAGAKGDTKDEMAAALSYRTNEETLHAGFNRVDLELAERGDGAKSSSGGDFALRSVNQLFGAKGQEYQASYLDMLAQNYGAGMSRMDFVGAADAARTEINDWVSTMTDQLIVDLLPEGSVHARTVLVLVNAVYFDAAWSAEFRTRDADFEGQRVDGFGGVSPGRYLKANDFEAAAIPYDGDEIELVVIEPNDFETFTNDLTGERFAAVVDALERQQIDLTMPKFDIESEHDMEKHLRAMGVTKLFDAADLSGIAGAPGDLFVEWVVQKAIIKVSEKGTVAAAATAGGVGIVSIPPPPTPVVIDKSFVYALRDVETGTILFIGHVRKL